MARYRQLIRCYDQIQLDARWLSWLCCRRTVIATNPNHRGCASCRG